MSVRPVRFGVLASTGGAVLGRLLESAWFRRHLVLVATDRDCGALNICLQEDGHESGSLHRLH